MPNSGDPPRTVEEAHAAGARDGAAGLGPIPPRDPVLKAAYMQSYRDNIVARVGVKPEPERRKNPHHRPAAPASTELKRATRLYRAFREAEPRGVRRVTVHRPRNKALVRMGICEFIGYMTTHNGKPALYVHHFAPGSRPALYAGTNRNELALVGGRFHVTGRGITDLDANGRETDYTPRYSVNPRRRRR
jgi:hypothetical protein